MAKISIIVPMYGVEKYINGCLESIQAQTFDDFECVCVDDGSLDKSGELAENFATTDKRFTVIHQKNGGLSAARNTGVRNSSAPYVLFLDSDDYIHPQMLEFLYKAIQQYKTPVVACTTQDTTETYQPITPDLKFDEIKIEVFDNPLDAFCHKKFKTAVMPRLYERAFVEQIPFVEGIYFEDIPFTAVCCDRLEKLPLLHAPMYYYYRQSNSIMRSAFSAKKVDSYDILIRHLHTYFTQNRPEKLPLARKRIFNQRVKMMLNQCIRKQSDKRAQEQLFAYAADKVKNLYSDGIVSLDGLKWKHKLAVRVLLRHSAKTACRAYRIATKLP